jgi:hypothetical protein
MMRRVGVETMAASVVHYVFIVLAVDTRAGSQSPWPAWSV